MIFKHTDDESWKEAIVEGPQEANSQNTQLLVLEDDSETSIAQPRTLVSPGVSIIITLVLLSLLSLFR